MTHTYFDYAAATPLSEIAKRAMAPYASDLFYNPSATYQAAQDVRHVIEDARRATAGRAR